VDYPTPADLLVRAFNLPPPDREPVQLPPGEHCAVSGKPITVGYPMAQITTTATTEFLDAFRGGQSVCGYVSEAAARCYRAASPRLGNPCARAMLLFADGTGYLPIIREDTKGEVKLPRLLEETGAPISRPRWTDLVREVWPERRGQMCLVIATTDVQKRLWIRARVGALGPRTPVLLHDGPLSEVRLIDWPRLIECLGLFEDVYTLGWSKEAIRTSLYANLNVCQAVGVAAARDLERRVAAWRERPEFAFAALIAQRRSTPPAPREELEKEVSSGHADRASLRAPDGPTQLALL
jgi:hypothetical protein